MGGETVARIFAILTVFSGYYFYFVSIGLTEVYIYGLGSVFIFYFFDWLEQEKYKSLIISAVFFILAALSKSSALLLLVFAAGLPFCLLLIDKNSQRQTGWKYWLQSFLSLFFVFFASRLVLNLLLPENWQAMRLASSPTKTIFRFKELINFPLDTWLSNFKFYFLHVVDSGFLVKVFGFLCGLALVIIILKRKEITKKTASFFLLAVIFWLLSFIPVVLLTKGNNLRHYGQWLYFFYLLLSVFLVIVNQEVFSRLNFKFFTRLIIFIIGILLLFLYQIKTSYLPAIRYGQTDAGQIETGDCWASPIGISVLLDFLKKLPPGVIIYNGQLGHLGTDMEVFAGYFPQLTPIDLGNKSISNLLFLKQSSKNFYILFDDWNLNHYPESLIFRKILTNKELCPSITEIRRLYKGQTYRNSWFVICRPIQGK